MWGQESCAQNGVVPIKNNASLTLLWFILRSQPDLVIGQTRHQLSSYLLIGSRVGSQISFVGHGVNHLGTLSAKLHASLSRATSVVEDLSLLRFVTSYGRRRGRRIFPTVLSSRSDS